MITITCLIGVTGWPSPAWLAGLGLEAATLGLEAATPVGPSVRAAAPETVAARPAIIARRLRRRLMRQRLLFGCADGVDASLPRPRGGLGDRDRGVKRGLRGGGQPAD